MNCHLPRNRQARIIGAWLVFLLAAGCTHPRPQDAEPSILAADTSLFAAVVRAARSRAAGRVSVDPRPLVAHPSVSDVDSSTLAVVSPKILIDRSAVLSGLGIPTTRDVSRGNCHSTTAAPPPPGVESPWPDDCPQNAATAIALGLPRVGGAYFPNRGLDIRSAMAEPDRVTVRVISAFRGPAGSTLRVSDYVMAKSSGHWVLVRIVGFDDD